MDPKLNQFAFLHSQRKKEFLNKKATTSDKSFTDVFYSSALQMLCVPYIQIKVL